MGECVDQKSRAYPGDSYVNPIRAVTVAGAAALDAAGAAATVTREVARNAPPITDGPLVGMAGVTPEKSIPTSDTAPPV